MKYAALLGLLLPVLAIAHPGGVDKNNGHRCSEKAQAKGLCQAYHLHQKSEANKYNRSDWPHWVDKDKDCQDTRAEILIRDSVIPVKFKRNKGCVVSHGKWIGPYTAETFTKASDVDIDHIVPLGHAHYHGASNWTRSQRREFANDPENLLAVDDSTNQQKSAQAPHQWMPPNKAYHCQYLAHWLNIKSKYQLTMSTEEKQFIDTRRKTCS